MSTPKRMKLLYGRFPIRNMFINIDVQGSHGSALQCNQDLIRT